MNFRTKLLFCGLLCCLLLIAFTCEAEEQAVFTLSGSGLGVTRPDAGAPPALNEPLESLANDFLDLRTLNIIFKETSSSATCRLTAASLAAVKKRYPFIPDKQYQELAAMQDKDYSEDDAAWAKAEALLAQLELHRSGLIRQYFIQDSLAAELKKAELPPFIIESVQELNGTRYIDSTTLASALQDQIRNKILSYKSDIMETAAFFNLVYFLSSDSLLILKGKGVPEQIVDKLTVLEKKYYIDKFSLSKEVRKILLQVVQDPGQDWINKTVEIAKKQGYLYTVKYPVLDQMLTGQPPEVAMAVRRENRKGCTLEALVKMTTANSVLLRNYFRQNKQILYDIGVQESVRYHPEPPNGAAMRRRGASKDVVEAVEALYGNTYSSKKDYVLDIQKLPEPVLPPPPPPPPMSWFSRFANEIEQIDFYRPLLPIQLTDVLRWNEPSASAYQFKPIDLQAKGCGCTAVPTNTVQGLYPYWAAMGAPSQIDFSALSRIGYFYLLIDEHSRIANQRHWQKQYSEFINQARQHKTKVDLVVHKEDWSCLSERDTCPAGKKAEELAELIVSQLAPELNNNLLNRLKPLFSLGTEPMPTMGDGIMLYLTDLPANPSCFLAFVKMLRERLLGLPFGTLPQGQELLADKRLSLLIPDHFFLQDKDTPAFASFKQFLAAAAAEPTQHFDSIVVAMRDRPAETAKKIRLTVEEHFPEQQAELNRKLIPLLTSSGGDKLDSGELDQTLRYAKNNFAGIGLFPVPVIEDADGKDKKAVQAACGGSDIYRLVKQQFEVDHSGQADMVSRAIKRHLPCLCKWACPNRWWIRISWDLLLLFCAVYAVAAFFYSPLEDVCRKYRVVFWLLAALTGSLIYLAFLCDPSYIDKTTDMLLLLLVLLALAVQWAVRKREYP